MDKLLKISTEHHKKLNSLSGERSMKAYIEFLIDYASILELKYQDFSNADMTNKEVHSSMVKKLTSRHNTVIAFIIEQDKVLAKNFQELAERDQKVLVKILEEIRKLK